MASYTKIQLFALFVLALGAATAENGTSSRMPDKKPRAGRLTTAGHATAKGVVDKDVLQRKTKEDVLSRHQGEQGSAGLFSHGEERALEIKQGHDESALAFEDLEKTLSQRAVPRKFITIDPHAPKPYPSQNFRPQQKFDDDESSHSGMNQHSRLSLMHYTEHLHLSGDVTDGKEGEGHGQKAPDHLKNNGHSRTGSHQQTGGLMEKTNHGVKIPPTNTADRTGGNGHLAPNNHRGKTYPTIAGVREDESHHTAITNHRGKTHPTIAGDHRDKSYHPTITSHRGKTKFTESVHQAEKSDHLENSQSENIHPTHRVNHGGGGEHLHASQHRDKADPTERVHREWENSHWESSDQRENSHPSDRVHHGGKDDTTDKPDHNQGEKAHPTERIHHEEAHNHVTHIPEHFFRNGGRPQNFLEFSKNTPHPPMLPDSDLPNVLTPFSGLGHHSSPTQVGSQEPKAWSAHVVDNHQVWSLLANFTSFSQLPKVTQVSLTEFLLRRFEFNERVHRVRCHPDVHPDVNITSFATKLVEHSTANIDMSNLILYAVNHLESVICDKPDWPHGNSVDPCRSHGEVKVHDYIMELLEELHRHWRPGYAHVPFSDTHGLDAFIREKSCFTPGQLLESLAWPGHPLEVLHCPQDRDKMMQIRIKVIRLLMEGQRIHLSGTPCEIDFVEDMFRVFGDTHLDVAGWTFSKQQINSLLSSVASSIDPGASGAKNGTVTSQDDLRRLHVTQDWAGNSMDADKLLYAVFGNDTERKQVNIRDFYSLCPAILHHVLFHPMTSPTTATSPVRSTPPAVVGTQLQVYGYGTLSVLIISLCSLVGALFIKLVHGNTRHYVMAGMLALAVGNLCGDAILHLLPDIIGAEGVDLDGDGHSSNEIVIGSSSDIEESTVKMCAMLGAIYLFFFVELIMSITHNHSHGEEEKSTFRERKEKSVDEEPVALSYTRRPEAIQSQAASASNSELTISTIVVELEERESPPLSRRSSSANQRRESCHVEEFEHKVPKSLAWMVIICDSIHNVADGLAIGASFSQNMTVGLTTSIAVFCHELPHELGDFAVLIASGQSIKRALVLNFVSSLTAFIGLYVGIVAGSQEIARNWIFSVGAGMFLYVALADLVPELQRYFQRLRNWRMFLVQNVGILTGYAVMVTIAIFEDEITI